MFQTPRHRSAAAQNSGCVGDRGRASRDTCWVWVSEGDGLPCFMGLRGFCQVLVWVIVVISGACGPQRQGNSLRGWGPAAGARWGVGLGTMSRRGTEASDLGPGGRNGITGSPRGVREPTPICRVQTWSPRSWEEQTCSGGPVCPGESDAESLPTHGRHPEPVHLVLEFLPHPRQTFDLPRGGETPERIMSPASGGGRGRG